MATSLIIEMVIINVLSRTMLLLFIIKKIKQKKTKIYSFAYTIACSAWIVNLLGFNYYASADIGLIFVALFSTTIDVGILQWFRAFWEKDEDTKDIDYGDTSLH